MIPITNEVRIETSTKCNLSCVFCPHSTQFKRKKEIMSYNMFCTILDKIKLEKSTIDTVTISGFGEAFLDNTILDKIEYARSKGYKVLVLTNGTLLTPFIINSLESLGIESLRISLHTTNQYNYKKITKSNLCNKVVSSIDNIIDSNLKLIISCEIIDINKNDINDIVEKYKEKVYLIEMWKPHNWVTAYNYRNKTPLVKTCGRPFNGPIQIQIDGTINMCCFDFNGELLLGNFLKNSLQYIFNDKPFKEIESFHHGNSIISSLICKNCDQRSNSSENIVYNSKFSKTERIHLTSTNYKEIDR